LHADGIVNAANSHLVAGGGVDGAIHRAGGTEIDHELAVIRNKAGGCPVGQAVVTSAGNLPAKFVIHTVGPIWSGGTSNESTLLAQAYRSVLLIARDRQMDHIAIPNISTGIYGYPKFEAAKIAVREVRLFFQEKHLYPRQVTFCCFDEENFNIYHQLLEGSTE